MRILELVIATSATIAGVAAVLRIFVVNPIREIVSWTKRIDRRFEALQLSTLYLLDRSGTDESRRLERRLRSAFDDEPTTTRRTS